MLYSSDGTFNCSSIQFKAQELDSLPRSLEKFSRLTTDPQKVWEKEREQIDLVFKLSDNYSVIINPPFPWNILTYDLPWQ